MGKNYWMKVKRDFFKRHDIKILKAEGGEDVTLFYIQLLAESIDHDGRLRYSEKKAYTPGRLATITETKPETVKKALTLLKELDLLVEEEDGTLYLPEAEHMVGSETEWAEKKRRQRGQQEDKPGTDGGQSEDNVPEMSQASEDKQGTKKDNVRQEIEKEIELELEREKEIDLEIEKELESERKKREKGKPRAPVFKKPTLEEIKAYCQERKNTINPEQFLAYYEANGWKVGKNPMKDWRAAIRSWETREDAKPVQHQAPAVIQYMHKEYNPEEQKRKEEDDLAALLGEEEPQ